MDQFIEQCYKSVISALKKNIAYKFPKRLLKGEGIVNNFPWFISKAGDVVITEYESNHEGIRKIKIEIGRDSGELVELLSNFISELLDNGVALEKFRGDLVDTIGKNIDNEYLEDLSIKCDLKRGSLLFIIEA